MDDDSAKLLLDVAEAVADAKPVDWHACDATGSQVTAQLRGLRLVESVASAYRSLAPPQVRPDTNETLFEWGHLQVVARLGGGSFGEVFRAYDPLLDREVALKLRRAESGPQRSSRRSFVQEARRLARIRHRNVVTVYGADIHDGRVGLWMDLVDGVTLEQWLAEEGVLGAEEAAVIGVDLCHALAAVHAAGLVHGDVKTANVMRERGGRIVLMDFGSGAELTDAGNGFAVCGTPVAMAPELLRGEEPTPASDIYSLGALLFRLASKRYPVEARTIPELFDRINRQDRLSLGDVRPDLPHEFIRVVERALAGAPGERYASAGAMERALLQCLAPTDSEARSSTATVLGSGGRGGEAVLTEDATPASVAWPRRRSTRIVAMAAAVTLAVAGAALVLGSLLRGRHAPAPPQVRSLAVLPFQALAGSSNEDYLGLGVADALINRLSHLRTIAVRPTSAVLRYTEGHADAAVIGRELGVDALLDGRIQRSGNRVRLTVQLISTHDGSPMWAATFDSASSGIFELEDSISEDVAGALRIRLSESEKAGLTWRPTTSADAYQAYVEGRYFFNRWTGEAIQKSIHCFKGAVEIDPAFALAYAGLADAYSTLPRVESPTMVPAEAYALAREAATRALEIAPALGQAHGALGNIYFHHDWSWTAARNELERAIELSPSHATARMWYAELLSAMGQHDQAIAEIRRALEIEPLSMAVNATAGSIYLAAGRLEEAAAQLNRTLKTDPTFYLGYAVLASVYEHKGENDQAVANWQNAMSLSGSSQEEVAAFGRAFETKGIDGAWQWRLDHLREQARRGYVSPVEVARTYAALGRKDDALFWLQKAVEEHDERFLTAGAEPVFAKLRSNDRFEELQRSLGLSESAGTTLATGTTGAPVRAAGALTVAATLHRDRSGRAETITDGAEVRPGDHLFLTLSTDEPVYFYVLNEDSVGNVFVLFPLAGLDSTNPLPASHEQHMPGRREGALQDWLVTSAGGKEKLLLIGARRQLPALEQQIAQFAGASVDRRIQMARSNIDAGGLTRGIGGLAPAASPMPVPRKSRLAAVLAGLAPLTGEGSAWVKEIVLTSSSP